MNDPTHPELSALRDAISDVDRAVLELLRRRMELAAEVGRIKAESGAPVVIRDVEDRVLTRARQYAEACGVSEEVMESVFQAIIRGSVERQHRVGVSLRRQHGERMLIIGGAGGMGSWFRGFFQLAGHEVDIVDPSLASVPDAPGRFRSLDDLDDLDRYAAILVAVPLGRTPEVLAQVVERKPRGAVIEVASIKSHLVSVLERARELGVRVYALHPMFGPGKSFYESLTFVLAAQGDLVEERKQVEAFIRHPYTRLVVVTFQHHDRLMGSLLGLAHLSNIVFGAALTRCEIDSAELHACASASFSRQTSTALLVLNANPDLYLDIQYLNPHRHEVYAATREALDHIEELVEGCEREGFRETLAEARRALSGG
ncbi:MAG TPA: prephenate dehydrogenase/arogenate dehydrogenase family protein [Thermoanaerobaculia bacterium]|nr:prephenate dehydrogenase/arogenate dehydrogenase family protein [Thermoanaerobaculia bacterium]